ncbi:hypothetical protein COU57_06510 [Candidatus Pacearchaeota archaeon CG10_big_fil_rev_8_21_14_0_10_32_14]|nr:MAG: hypothetical protein COU57_06510 [Candidatus Pacearchaeota archaeon CG10_big_fil_rev_8_21_14_0_10_32_14]
MKTHKTLLLCFCIVIFILITFFYIVKNHQKTSFKSNQEALDEINNLLGPLEAQNISQNDFLVLKDLVKDDKHASGEIIELIALSDYKEYSHVGHGIGFLYEYLKTGKERNCPGHSLSHYYVYMKHGNYDLASDNLREAKNSVSKWEKLEETHNSTYLNEQDYFAYKKVVEESIKNINKGNSTVSNDFISYIAEAPC